MRARLVVLAAVAAVAATVTIGPAAPAAAPLGSHGQGRHHAVQTYRVPVPAMHSMCDGEVV